jgi:hypothetical protein
MLGFTSVLQIQTEFYKFLRFLQVFLNVVSALLTATNYVLLLPIR